MTSLYVLGSFGAKKSLDTVFVPMYNCFCCDKQGSTVNNRIYLADVLELADRHV